MEIEDPIARYFYGLLTTKKPKEKEGDNALFIWGLKYLVGLSFFKISGKYYDFWRLSTQYYPFSLLYQDRLFHYKNQSVNKFMIKLQNLINRSNIKTTILTGEYGGQFCEFYGTFNKKSENTPGNIELIDKALQEKLDTIYTRDNKDGFKVLVPTQMLVNMNVLSE